jgi:hypothetical protein
MIVIIKMITQITPIPKGELMRYKDLSKCGFMAWIDDVDSWQNIKSNYILITFSGQSNGPIGFAVRMRNGLEKRLGL